MPKPKVVVFVEGGLVQDIIADSEIDCILIDKDVEEPDESLQLKASDGEAFTAALTEYSVLVNPQLTEHYWNQIPAM